MSKALVTGAAGFIGSHLAERLIDLGHEVVAIDSFTDFYERSRKERNLAAAVRSDRFSLIEGDLLNLDLAEVLAGVDFVFHLAAQAGVRPSWGTTFSSYIRNNIAATQCLLEATKEQSIRRFVYASSSSVYGDAPELPATEATLPSPVSPYGVTKLAAEYLCSLYSKAYGLPAISLRLFTVYGPRQRPDMAIQKFLAASAAGEPIVIYGDGLQTRDFTFVQDVVSALVGAAESDTEIGVLNICGGSTVSVREVLSVVQAVTGRAVPLQHMEAARGDARHTFGSNLRARTALGFHPRMDLRGGIAAQWDWMLHHEMGRS